MLAASKEILTHSDGTVISLLDQGTDHYGDYLIVEHLVTKSGPLNGPHWHPMLKESFTVKQGKMRFIVDGEEHVLGSGQHIEIYPKQVHQFWNESKDRLIAIHEIRPPGNHWNMFKLIHKLEVQNSLNSKGIPRNPLWLGMAWECIDGYLDGPPIFLQKMVLGGLARLAHAIGYRI